ncbi:MAG: 50S ribosomal protein L24 [Patescibacteria group bacterium]
MKIRTGDKVTMLAGKNKGKSGKVLQVMAKENKVVIEGLNLLIKHQKARKSGEKGQRIQFPAAVPVSKTALVCPKCGQAARVGFKLDGKTKSRMCKKCREII